jgi:hypothetical protein
MEYKRWFSQPLHFINEKMKALAALVTYGHAINRDRARAQIQVFQLQVSLWTQKAYKYPVLNTPQSFHLNHPVILSVLLTICSQAGLRPLAPTPAPVESRTLLQKPNDLLLNLRLVGQSRNCTKCAHFT